MNAWYEAVDTLQKIEGEYVFEEMSLDQQLKVAEIRALIAIGQELSTIHHEGINPEYRH